MKEKNVLLVVSDKNEIQIKGENFIMNKVEMAKKDEIIKKLDNEWYDSYDFVYFQNKSNLYNYIGHYFPLNLEENHRNQIYINELLINSIIISNIDYLISEEYLYQISIIIRHIIRKDIRKEQFDFNDEIRYICNFNKYKKNESKQLSEDIYNAIKENYCQKSILRLREFKINKDEIVKMFLFKVYNNIIEDIKKNTEIDLVFKKLISIAI